MNHYDAVLVENPTELEDFLQPLVSAGVDIFHVSTRRFWEPAFQEVNGTLAGWTRKLSGRPVILVGSIGLDGAFTPGSSIEGAAESTRLQTLIDLFDAGEFELAAIGRALISDPNWVLKTTDGRPLERVDFDQTMLQHYV